MGINRCVNLYDKYCECRRYYALASLFKKILRTRGFKSSPVPGELQYLKKWSLLRKKIEPYSYRLFSHYCGFDSRIIPEDIGVIIELILNPVRFRAYYSDKNLYDDYLDPETLPKSLLRRVNGGQILDRNFEPANDEIRTYIENYKRVIVKPSNDSCSGHGVFLFEKNNDKWVCTKTKQALSYSFLNNYGKDIIVQEALEQHPFMSHFNESSVNTLRLTVYRSVKNENVVVPSAAMRIGQKGEIVDNGHAGGRFVGIDPLTGKLNDFISDQYGLRSDEWNGICFSQNEFYVPSWTKVLDFAKSVGKVNRHCRLLGLDIMIDKLGNPKLIEYNVGGFSFWLIMFSGYTVLGEYTNEVIEWCVTHRHDASRMIVG